jgi:CMP-N-acetylneuraminic acid synthetase
MITTVGIILARGGSKRIPRKNLKPMCGRPLVEWTIIAAAESKLDAVILSSDSDDILHVARGHRCLPVKRPAEMATDDASSYPALLHAYDVWKMSFLTHALDIMLLQPTSPLRDFSHVNAMLLEYRTRTAPRPTASFGESSNVPNGAMYLAPAMWVVDGNTWDCDDIARYVMADKESIDINTQEEFCIAERRMENYLNTEIRV